MATRAEVLAEIRSSAVVIERLLWRKLTLRIRFSEAENDP
jgi:hypothetical protein